MVTINEEHPETLNRYGYAIHGITPTPPWVERHQPTWWQRLLRLFVSLQPRSEVKLKGDARVSSFGLPDSNVYLDQEAVAPLGRSLRTALHERKP